MIIPSRPVLANTLASILLCFVKLIWADWSLIFEQTGQMLFTSFPSNHSSRISARLTVQDSPLQPQHKARCVIVELKARIAIEIRVSIFLSTQTHDEVFE